MKDKVIADERMKKLNQLFDDLKTKNYSIAYKVEQEIWQIWSTHPNDESLTMLLNEGSSLVNESYGVDLPLDLVFFTNDLSDKNWGPKSK